MSNYRQNYQPPHRSPTSVVWFIIGVILVGVLLAIGGKDEDAKRTAEQKLSAALDDAYQAGVRDAQRACHRPTTQGVGK